MAYISAISTYFTYGLEWDRRMHNHYCSNYCWDASKSIVNFIVPFKKNKLKVKANKKPMNFWELVVRNGWDGVAFRG